MLRFSSGNTLSALAAILFIASIAGDTAIPLALTANGKLVLFDAPDYRAMFTLLGALHALAALFCIASIRQNLKAVSSSLSMS